MYKKLTKKDIKKIMKDISPIIIIDNAVHTEKFKQLIFEDGTASPYIISSAGRIFSINYHHIKNNITRLKTCIDKDGYELIIINYNKKSYGYGIHRLVAMAFIKNSNPIKYTQVNHINGNKLDNYMYNLEWVTPKENIHHAWKYGLTRSTGENNGRNVYSSQLINKVCKLLEDNVSIKNISNVTGVSYAMVSMILRHKNWTEISDNYDFTNYKYGK